MVTTKIILHRFLKNDELLFFFCMKCHLWVARFSMQPGKFFLLWGVCVGWPTFQSTGRSIVPVPVNPREPVSRLPCSSGPILGWIHIRSLESQLSSQTSALPSELVETQLRQSNFIAANGTGIWAFAKKKRGGTRKMPRGGSEPNTYTCLHI